MIGRPDTNSVALLDFEGHEKPRQLVDVSTELGLRPADTLMAGNQSLAAGVGLAGSIEDVTDGLADQWLGVGAVGIAEHHGFLSRSPHRRSLGAIIQTGSWSEIRRAGTRLFGSRRGPV
jgi:hypothetical protein